MFFFVLSSFLKREMRVCKFFFLFLSYLMPFIWLDLTIWICTICIRYFMVHFECLFFLLFRIVILSYVIIEGIVFIRKYQPIYFGF